MSEKRYIVRLSGNERARLKALLQQKRLAAQKRARAQVLLKVDEGEDGPAWTDAKAAAAFDVHEETVRGVSPRPRASHHARNCPTARARTLPASRRLRRSGRLAGRGEGVTWGGVRLPCLCASRARGTRRHTTPTLDRVVTRLESESYQLTRRAPATWPQSDPAVTSHYRVTLPQGIGRGGARLSSIRVPLRARSARGQPCHKPAPTVSLRGANRTPLRA